MIFKGKFMTKLKLIFTFLLFISCIGIASGQENFDDPNTSPPENQQRRPSLLRELDLTKEQIQEIRRINQSNVQNIRPAQERVAEARRNLDDAIYDENMNEATVKLKLREFQEAQAEVAKIRAHTEFSIRKVLTPEQLTRFRELRQRFDQVRRDRQQNQKPLRMRNQMKNQRRNNSQTSPPNR